MIADESFREAVADLIYTRLCRLPGFVERTDARGFRELTSGRSRVQKGAVTTGGTRFRVGRVPDRRVFVERLDDGYHAVVVVRVGGEKVEFHHMRDDDLDRLGYALLDALKL